MKSNPTANLIEHTEGSEQIEKDHDIVQLCRPVSSQPNSVKIEGGQLLQQTRRCASEKNIVTSCEDADALPEISSFDEPRCSAMRDINMARIKDVDQLAALGLRRLRFALQCRGAYC
jgi:hypothetical protein